MTLRDFVLGRYANRYVTVTAKRWWSRSDRKAARLSAAIIGHQFASPVYQDTMRAAVRDAIVTGEACLRAERGL